MPKARCSAFSCFADRRRWANSAIGRSDCICLPIRRKSRLACSPSCRRRNLLFASCPAGPGQKEHRYIQLLSAETKIKPAAASEKQATILVDESRLESMDAAIQRLRQELESLRQDFVQFKKQFE